VVAC
jgi:CRP-like cAMP-binding protein